MCPNSHPRKEGETEHQHVCAHTRQPQAYVILQQQHHDQHYGHSQKVDQVFGKIVHGIKSYMASLTGSPQALRHTSARKVPVGGRHPSAATHISSRCNTHNVRRNSHTAPAAAHVIHPSQPRRHPEPPRPRPRATPSVCRQRGSIWREGAYTSVSSSPAYGRHGRALHLLDNRQRRTVIPHLRLRKRRHGLAHDIHRNGPCRRKRRAARREIAEPIGCGQRRNAVLDYLHDIARMQHPVTCPPRYRTRRHGADATRATPVPYPPQPRPCLPPLPLSPHRHAGGADPPPRLR